ncbi:hypothetical protein F5Y16DRAFT_399745 [Xylariaceae sp. FL0255]|nr:hypothetical protein F5Y16DRAFT_399745 [Xylariaceae sp. FL0255]
MISELLLAALMTNSQVLSAPVSRDNIAIIEQRSYAPGEYDWRSATNSIFLLEPKAILEISSDYLDITERSSDVHARGHTGSSAHGNSTIQHPKRNNQGQQIYGGYSSGNGNVKRQFELTSEAS